MINEAAIPNKSVSKLINQLLESVGPDFEFVEFNDTENEYNESNYRFLFKPENINLEVFFNDQVILVGVRENVRLTNVKALDSNKEIPSTMILVVNEIIEEKKALYAELISNEFEGQSAQPRHRKLI